MSAHILKNYPLIIAGGCYKELCERPRWNAMYGSGGRAAAALVGITPEIELYTYCPPERLANLDVIRDRGIVVHSSPSKNEISFAYLHPLSPPGVEPRLSDVISEEPIHCRGEVILRFGFLEGDAVVHGERVIFDPQTVRGAPPFKQNGSSAEHLALVLNADELLGSVLGNTIEASVPRILSRDNADVVVIKCGANGAAVLEKGRDLCWIPAFQTPRVFKIGSGDVFSATFAHYWGVERRSAVEAANLASRSTAAYCASRQLPIPIERSLPVFPEAVSNAKSQVGVVANRNSLANLWLIEETCWHLKQLGRPTHILDTDLRNPNSSKHVGSALILADTFDDGGSVAVQNAERLGLPVVVLQERAMPTASRRSPAFTTNDFTTALYWTIWK